MPVPTLITDLDTAAANNSPPGTESARGNIDNYLRAHASFIRQVFNGVQSGSYAWAGTAGGTANALTLTLAPAITAYSAGQRFVFKSGASANSGATTAAVSGLTPLAVQVNGVACVGAEIAANKWYEVLVDASLTSCQLSKIGRATLAELGGEPLRSDAGQVAYFAMSTAPTGWLKANGAAVSRATYSVLFAAIGTTFGVGDGTTTFTLPDLRGEFIRGLDDSRGVDVARVLGSAQSGDNAPHTHTGTTSSDGAHTHTYTAQNAVAAPSRNASGSDAISSQTLNTSSDGAHTHTMTTASSGTEARPRNIALLACIKY